MKAIEEQELSQAEIQGKFIKSRHLAQGINEVGRRRESNPQGSVVPSRQS